MFNQFSWFRSLLLALLAWLVWPNVGCNADGYAPGPAVSGSALPIPGVGVLHLGEAKRTLVLSGMRGVAGATYPDIDQLTYTSDPTVALLARGQAQQGVEGQRWDKAILAMERTADKIGDLAGRLTSLYGQYQAAQPAPAPPTANQQAIEDARTAAILKALEALGSKIDSKTKPTP